MERHAEVGEELHRLRYRQGAQHLPYRGARAAVEVGLGHLDVRDIAAAAAADQDLGPRAPGAIEEPDAGRAIEPAGEDGGRESGRAGTDDGNVEGHARSALPARQDGENKDAAADGQPGVAIDLAQAVDQPGAEFTQRVGDGRGSRPEARVFEQRLRQQQRGHARIVP